MLKSNSKKTKKDKTMATIKNNEEIIELLNSAKYLLRGHKQNLNVQWSIDKINQAIKALK